jgi:phosphohistidine phosphatase
MILLVHHAEAVGPEVDPMRPLSTAGRAHAAGLAAAAAARGARPDVIWHSGKLRARQTAEAFWSACNPFATFAAVRGLQPDDPPLWIRDRLAGETQSIAVVGHMPHLPRLLAMLTHPGNETSRVTFPLHSCIALDAQNDRWVELWRLEQ